MPVHQLRGLLVGTFALALAACGGGGGGVNSTPFVPEPPAAPPQTGSSVLPPAHLGLVSSQPFAVVAVDTAYKGGDVVPAPAAVDVQFTYDAPTNTYQIALPDFAPGKLVNTFYNGTVGEVATSTTSQVSDGTSTGVQSATVFLPVPKAGEPYSYTSWGSWVGLTGSESNGDSGRTDGYFAYGIPTPASGMPIAGTANYAAEIKAMDSALGSSWLVGGDAQLTFDFAAGTLAGWMHPQIVDGFDGFFVDYGRYDFKDTVYSTGSTTFSGRFVVPNLPDADSFFDGRFNGPGAAEIMARFAAPYLLSGQSGSLSGIWIGKKTGP